jgi:DNA-directed RNA polymerase subunit E"
MTVKDKVCRNCKLFVKAAKCPLCNQSNFSRSWSGVVVIREPASSEVAAALGITMPGKYCLWTK